MIFGGIFGMLLNIFVGTVLYFRTTPDLEWPLIKTMPYIVPGSANTLSFFYDLNIYKFLLCKDLLQALRYIWPVQVLAQLVLLRYFLDAVWRPFHLDV